MYKVLVMCHANRWRSPLAMGYMRQAVADINLHSDDPPLEVSITSAGFKESGKPAGKPVREVAKKFGFSLDDHRSTQVTVELVAANDAIVVMDGGNFRRLIELVDQQASCAGKSVFRLGEFCPLQRSRIEDLAFISPKTNPEKFEEVTKYIRLACYRFTENVIAPRAAKGQA